MRIIPREITDAAANIGVLVGKINAAGGGDNAAALLVELREEVERLQGLTAKGDDIADHVNAIAEAILAQLPSFLTKAQESLGGVSGKGESVLGHYGQLGVILVAIFAGLRDGRALNIENVRFTPDGICGKVYLEPEAGK